MKIIKTILNIILSFSLILIIIATILVNNLDNKILNKNYMLSKLDEVQVYLQISREVKSGFENYIYQSGLPEDTIENLATEEMIKKDVNSIIDYIYDGTDIKISSEKVQEELDNKINKYVESQDIKLNNQGKSNIKKFETLIVNEYDKNVNVSDLMYKKVHDGIQKIDNINSKIGKLPIIAITVVIILLIIINIKDLLVAINYIGISLLSSGILLTLVVNLIFKNVDIDNLLILANSISSVISSIIKDILYGIQDNANLFMVAGIVAILATSILKNIGNSKK